VEAVDAGRREHLVEVDVEVGVGEDEVGEARLVREAAVDDEAGLADLEAGDQPVGVERGELEAELGVGAAELDLDAAVGGEVGGALERPRPHAHEVLAERVDVLADLLQGLALGAGDLRGVADEPGEADVGQRVFD
jgi:hypothetical protein